MLSTDELLRMEEPFDGRYRLLRLLSTEKKTSDAWLAADLDTLDPNDIDLNDESSAKLVVLKIYRLNVPLDQEGEEVFRERFKIVQECRHPNLITPEGVSVFEGMPYLVIPYCEAGSAGQLIGQAQTADSMRKFISDVASGLQRLHNNRPAIVHHNIKPSNILINGDNNFAITDFGITPMCHDKAYCAPECSNSRYKLSPQNDIWALGMTLCEVFTGNREPSLLSRLPSDIKNLILACLDSNPSKRPSAQEIVEMMKPKGKKKSRTGLIVTLSIAAVLILGIIIHFATKTHSDNPVYTYEQVEQMLGDQETALHGKHLLDSLVTTNDYMAIFLMSRLYFDNSDSRDTAFYEQKWADMRANCGIMPDNQIAHEYLFKAFILNESDPVLLYQLGYDYHAGERRGCTRKTDYALWCYQHAEEALSLSTHQDRGRYLCVIRERMEKILSDDSESHSPIKPTNP